MSSRYIPGSFFQSGSYGQLRRIRNFTTTDNAFGMYYTIPEYTMALDDTVEFEYLAPTGILANNQNFFGGDVAGVSRSRLIMTNTGVFFQDAFDNTMLLDGTPVSTSSSYPVDGKLHTIKLTASTTKIIGTIASVFNGSNTYSGVMYDFVIKNSGGVIQRDYRIDETWIGPSTVLVDYSGNAQHGTAVNIDVDDSEPFTFDGAVSPNTWTNDDETIVIEVAGT